MSDSESGPPPQRRTSKVVLIVVVCVAIGAVLAMRFLSPPDATAGDPEIDRKIDEVLRREAENPSTPAPVIEVFPGGPVAPEGGPPRNPFVGERPRVVQPPADPKEARRQEIEQAVGQLQLQGVMTGSHPVATINGRNVRLNSVFSVSPGEAGRPVELRVTSISKGAVTLITKDADLDLTVETTLQLKKP